MNVFIPENIQNELIYNEALYSQKEVYEIGNIDKKEYNRLLNKMNKISLVKTEYRIYYSTNNGYKIYIQDEYGEKIKYETTRRYYEYKSTTFPLIVFIDKTFPTAIQETLELSKTLIYNYFILNDITILLIGGDKYHFRLYGNVTSYILEKYINLYLETDIIYSIQERNEILKFIELSINLDNLRKYKILTYNDLVSGKLILGDKTYTVSHLIKGQKKLLIIHPSGIWLFELPNKLNRITNTKYPVYYGVILEGYTINKDDYGINAPKTNNWFIAQDCLTFLVEGETGYLGSKDIQNQTHKTRMLACQIIADRFKTNYLYITTPSFKELDVSKVFPRIRETLYRQNTLPLKCCGLIFYPAGKYNDGEILIWEFKPTIRLLALNENKNIGYYVLDGNKLVEFNGTEEYKFVKINIPQVENDNIVEYDGKDVFIYGNTINPDTLESALEKWNAINNPIKITTIRGEDSVLFDMHIKRIINELSKNSLVITSIPNYVTEKITLINFPITQNLIKYIKSGVKQINFIGIDKLVAHQAFIPKNGIPFKYFKTLYDEYHFYNDYIKVINIKTKDEKIIYFMDIEVLLNNLNYLDYSYHIADNEKLLPDDYLIISQLYSYGTIVL